jgi:pimeloyl-ACP methyl ester carboxylesterase
MSHADVNGVSLYYEERGSGEPLVLLHGGIGAGEMVGAIMPALSAKNAGSSPSTCRGTAARPTSTARCVRRPWPMTSQRSSSTSPSPGPT